MIEVGRVIGTERRPNTAYTFYFWTAPDAPIGIGTLVRVEAEASTVYGVVVEVEGFNDLESPLHEFLSVGGETGIEPPTKRPEMRVYQAAVLRREPEEPIGAVPIGRVFVANEVDVHKALRTDRYAAEWGIPAGCYGPKDQPVPVHLHSHFLLGPEAGHLNITGTSGLAAKTSFILFLLRSIFDHYRDSAEDRNATGVAALLFNTKGGDLLYIDQPMAEAMSEDDRRRYDVCNVSTQPFEKVRYFAPVDKDGFNLNTIRRNPDLEASNPTMPFTFGLKDVIKHAEVLLNKEDLDAKADAYLQYVNDRFIESKEGHQIGGQGEFLKASNLKQLGEIINKQLRWAEANNQSQIESHSALTVRKMYNRIYNLSARFGGLIAERGDATGPFDKPFEPNTVYVVDVAGLDSECQDLVFSAMITELRERMEGNGLGVARLIVMVDELNKYAPSGAAETYVVKSLKEIASRGRYLGLTLFGAQQFRSRVDKEVVGNAATHAFGHIEAEELAQPGYSYFTPAIKEKLGSIEPGQVLLKHPHFAQPIFVSFPKPPCMKGQDGMRRYPMMPRKELYDIVCDEFKRLQASFNRCKDVLDTLSLETANLQTVLTKLRKLDPGEDPIPVLESGKKVVTAVRRETRVTVDDDPFATLSS